MRSAGCQFGVQLDFVLEWRFLEWLKFIKGDRRDLDDVLLSDESGFRDVGGAVEPPSQMLRDPVVAYLCRRMVQDKAVGPPAGWALVIQLFFRIILGRAKEAAVFSH